MNFKIKEIRERRKLSQAELSRLSGVSRPTIIRLEKGEDVVINSRTLENLSKALGVSVKSLFLP